MPRALLVETARENRRGRVDDEPQGRVEEDSRLDLWPKKVIRQKLCEQGGDCGDERSGSADPPSGADDDGQIEDLEIDLRRCNEISRSDRCDGQQRNETPKPAPTHGRGFSQVHALRGDQLGVGQARCPEQQREHSLVAVPVLGNDGLPRRPDDVAQDQSADHGVVQGTDDRDELRNEVDRRRDPGQTDPDQRLGPQRDALVAQETVKEPREIRQQQGQLAHCRPSAGNPEEQQRRQPHRENHDERDEHDLHALRLSGEGHATQSGGAPSGQEWIDRAKRFEALGYGTLAMPDHMIGGARAAMPALAVAATVTGKLRVGTLVIDRGIGTLR
jgi:hypothetical protein